MFIQSTIKLALKNLRAQKMRSFLTMLGIIIGISSVIIITSVVQGAQSLITNQFNSIGPNIVGVLPGGSEEDGPPAAMMGIVITSLKDSDTEAIKKLPHITAASSYLSTTDTVSWENQKTGASIYGVSPDYPKLSDINVDQGSFFSNDDKSGAANVIVIGSEIKESLFQNIDPLGQKIRIKNGKYTVIGVMEPVGTVGFQNIDNMIFMPITTAQKRILGINYIGFLRVRVDSLDNIDNAIADIEYLLRDRHNIDELDDFTVRGTAEAMDALNQITQALQFFLIAIVAISLVVGGIGIMNIMLASVTERIKEIGLRKAVGAKRKNIINQFLTETLVLSFFGTIIGIVIGSIISYLIAIIVNKLGYDWNFVITTSSIILSVIFAGIIGLFFGLYPAKKAARFDPIEALRYE